MGRLTIEMPAELGDATLRRARPALGRDESADESAETFAGWVETWARGC